MRASNKIPKQTKAMKNASTTTTVTTLANGVRVATDRMEHVESVTLGVWVGVGSRQESLTQTGTAHFLEHMVFKGTKNRTAQQIAAEAEASGGVLNAWTSRECTAYHIRLPAHKWQCGLDIVCDLVVNHTLDKTELVRERGVILQEIGMSNDTPEDVAFDGFQETAYPDQPLGMPILGTHKIIANMERATLANFAKTHYHPHNIVVAAAGKLDHKAITKWSEKKLGALKPPTGSAPATNSAPKADSASPTKPPSPASRDASYGGGSRVISKDLEQTHLVLGMQGPDYKHPLYFPLLVFSAALGGGMASRLFQEIREKRGLVYGIHTFFSPYRDSGLFGIHAGTSRQKLEELTTATSGEFTALAESATPKELERAKNILCGRILLSLESTATRADRLSQQLVFYNRPYSPEEIIEAIRQTTKQDITAIGEFLRGSKSTLVVAGPKPPKDLSQQLNKALKAGGQFPLAA